MSFKRLHRGLCAAALAVLATSALAAPLVNGDFESGDLAGWTLHGDQTFVGVDSGFSQSGAYAAYFGPETPAGISQTLTLAANSTYAVSFWLSLLDSATPNAFSWSWNGTEQQTLEDVGVFAYTKYTGLVATDSNGVATLSFEFSNPASFWLLDDVSVTQVPEPAGLALAALCLALLVAQRRNTSRT